MPSKFRQILKDRHNGDVIIPRIRTSLANPTFSGFNIPVRGFENRIPDNRFHPSEHPTWSEDKLVEYLMGNVEREKMEINGIFAVTQGSFWHAFIQNLGIIDGWLRRMDPLAQETHDQAEFWVEDTILGTGGHMDGVLNSEILGQPFDTGFEMKTINGMKANKCPKGSPDSPAKIDWLKRDLPVYDAQAQEYMRMSGYTHQRFLFLTLEYPYPMFEILLPFDPELSYKITEKYKRARERFDQWNSMKSLPQD